MLLHTDNWLLQHVGIIIVFIRMSCVPLYCTSLVSIHTSSNLQIDLADFTYLTRIHYKAASDSTWGEHEVDYILFLQKDIGCTPNPNEVMSYKYVNQEQLKLLLERGQRGEVKVTPWFRIICDSFLFKWWNSLDDLSSCVNVDVVHKMI